MSPVVVVLVLFVAVVLVATYREQKALERQGKYPED